MDWLPTISEGSGPIYRRIADALTNDITNGRLKRGQQLPTHRALAQALRLDLTTVTRAYGEARRRGLLDARVGQGTFVSETTTRATADLPHPVKIDLSMNVPPQPIEANLDIRIAQGLASIQKEAGFSAFLNYQRPGGSDGDRNTAANWLRVRVPKAQADRLIIYPGTQSAIFNVLLSLTSRGDVVLTEALTYPGVRAVAERLGIRLVGVIMDEQGILPEALGSACWQHKPKAVYLVPTMHNPTTVTLSPSRRKAIAEIIRKAGVILIEDDPYGALDPSVSPIANLIPDKTYLAVSLSKCIAPALRISFLLTPDVAAEQMLRNNLQATPQMASPFMVALVMNWLRSGVADQIVTAIRNEAIGRQQLTAKILKGQSFAAYPAGHHIWLSLPRHWSKGDFIAHVLRNGLAVVGSEAFAVDQAGPQAVRVSLGAARNRTELSTALYLLAALLKPSNAAMQIVQAE